MSRTIGVASWAITIALTPPFKVEVEVEYKKFGVGVEVEVGRGRGWWAGALVDKNRVES